MPPIKRDIVRSCRSCGALFIIGKRSKNQLCCHMLCRTRARRRDHVQFPAPHIRATPLSITAVLVREFLYAQMPPHAIAFQLWCETLECWFPHPGRRQCFDGGYTEAPYFRLGGYVRDKQFIAWEAPRVPLNGRYGVRWVLEGGGILEPKEPLWVEIDFAQAMNGSGQVKQRKRLYAERLRLPEQGSAEQPAQQIPGGKHSTERDSNGG